MGNVLRGVGLVTFPVVLGLTGGLGFWFLEDMITDSIRSKPWFLPIIGALAGVGLGSLISSKVLMM
jgi:hypothetical protein